MDPAVLRLAAAVADELAARGAAAVVLWGSHVRGEAHARSALDLQALGRGPAYHLRRLDQRLVSVSWRTAAGHRRGLRTPAEVGGLVPAWRQALILYDPAGTAAELKRLALAWRWEPLARRCDAWVA